MSDVLISYSRKDKKFMENLHQTLIERQYEVWVDTKDIPATAAWLREIFAAIEAADNFVFVISPDSLASEICQMELSHALKNQKRIIPALLRQVENDSLPEGLSGFEQVSFQAHDDFSAALQKLIDKITANLEWVRPHTRFLIRAIEWDKNKRDPSFLLRGRVLREAEAWLAEGQDQSPPPSPLHAEFIGASLLYASRRRRVLTASGLMTLVALMVLGGVAVWQRQAAGERRLQALSRRLASQSRAIIDQVDARGAIIPPSSGVTDLALLLSLEANKRADTLESRGSLLAALQKFSKLSGAPLNDLQGSLSFPKSPDGKSYPEGPACISFSPDGKTLASGWRDGTVLLWNVLTGEPAGTPFKGFAVPILKMAFSDDGKTLAMLSHPPWGFWSLRQWDILQREFLGSPSLYEDNAFGITRLEACLSPDGKSLALSDFHHILLWDVGKEQRHPHTFFNMFKTETLSFSPDGKFLASGSEDGEIALFDVAHKKIMGRLKGEEGAAECLGFSPDGRILASGGDKGDIVLWDVLQRRRLGQPLRNSGQEIKSLAFSPDGKNLAALSGSLEEPRRWRVTLWDVASHQPLDPPLLARSHPCLLRSLAFSPNGQNLAVISNLDWSVIGVDWKSFQKYLHNRKDYCHDGAVLLNVSLESWRQMACRSARRNLTREEWWQYLGNEPYRVTCPQWPAPKEGDEGKPARGGDQ